MSATRCLSTSYIPALSLRRHLTDDCASPCLTGQRNLSSCLLTVTQPVNLYVSPFCPVLQPCRVVCVCFCCIIVLGTEFQHVLVIVFSGVSMCVCVCVCNVPVNERVQISVCNYSDSQSNCPQSPTTKRILTLSVLKCATQ